MSIPIHGPRPPRYRHGQTVICFGGGQRNRRNLLKGIRRMGEAITVMRNENRDPGATVPDRVQAYEIALGAQHTLFAREPEALR